MVGLGALYENALGVDRDMDKALALYTKAGELGNVIGQFRVGLLYDGGAWGPPTIRRQSCGTNLPPIKASSPPK